jgi:hypothetical protein
MPDEQFHTPASVSRAHPDFLYRMAAADPGQKVLGDVTEDAERRMPRVDQELIKFVEPAGDIRSLGPGIDQRLKCRVYGGYPL